jgi:hypothetical protein
MGVVTQKSRAAATPGPRMPDEQPVQRFWNLHVAGCRRLRRFQTALGLVWILIASGAMNATSAQVTGNSLIAGISVGTQAPGYGPPGAPHLLGVGVGLERSFRSEVTARISASWAKSWSMADANAACFPRPPIACFVPAYAQWYATFAVHGVWAPRWVQPAYVVAGLGWTSVPDEPYSQGRPATETQPVGSTPIVEAGIGLVLGSSRRAPRFEVLFTRFADPVGSANRLTQARLWLR